MSISLRHLRYFLAASQKGQIGLAAASLEVSQSTVTTSLQQLEGELGLSLFRRLPGGVELTVEGARFLPYARDVLDAVERAEQARLAEATPVAGRVRLGVSATLAGYCLPRPLARFQRTFPDVRVELSELSTQAIAEGLEAGRVDVGLAASWLARSPGPLVFEAVLNSRRRLWLCADHRLVDAPELGLAEIAHEPILTLAVDGEQEATARIFDAAGLKPRTLFATSSLEAVRDMVALGLGVAILPDLFYRPFSLSGRRVVGRAIADAVPALDVRLARPAGRKHDAAVQAFTDFLSRAAGDGL